jgi:glycosyltransferase involved in cell wall biosynthesis
MDSESAAGSPALYWRGAFAATHSLAHVNRSLCAALLRAGVDVARLPTDGAKADATPRTDAVPVVTHGWPPVLKPPSRGPWIAFQPWEYGSMPQTWLVPFRDRAAETWVYTEWNRARYVDDGLPKERVATIPLGIDPALFKPDAAPLPRLLEAAPSARRFLFVGGTIRRKGVDVLLLAWRRAFRRGDDVALIVKDFCKGGAYRGQTQDDAIRAAAADQDVAPIVYVDDDLPETDLKRLYASCDVLVHPYRGEGFGLPVLEALACGKPAIVTKGGACDAFCDRESALFVAADRVPVRAPEPLVKEGFLLEPVVDQLVALLRLAARHPERMRAMGAAAATRVAREWTWDRSAAVVVERLKLLAASPTPPATTAAAAP